MPSSSTLFCNGAQTALSRIWTLLAEFIFYDDNHFVTRSSNNNNNNNNNNNKIVSNKACDGGGCGDIGGLSFTEGGQ